MKKGFLRLLGVILVSVLPTQAVHADVAPSGGAFAALSLVALIACGVFVAVIVLVSFLVIRAIKKKHTPGDDA